MGPPRATFAKKAAGSDREAESRAQPPVVGGAQFSEELKTVSIEATFEAAAERHAKGQTVFVAGEDGNICELCPDGTTRKLSQAELDALS